MDWDGIGTFAMFIGTGGVGVFLILLQAYKMKLAAKLDLERLRHSSTTSDEVIEQIRDLETKVHRLTERVDFAERLLGDGHSEPSETETEIAATRPAVATESLIYDRPW